MLEERGRCGGVDVSDPSALSRVAPREPRGRAAPPSMVGLGPGETAVLALALESDGSVVILDDSLARRHAQRLKPPMTGTLGLLADGSRARLTPRENGCGNAVCPGPGRR